jgi:hypothetical protein
LNNLVMQYDSNVVSAPVEALLWSPPSNGDCLQGLDVVDRGVEALMTRLEDDRWTSVSSAGSYRLLLTSMLGQARNTASDFFMAPLPAKPVIGRVAPAPKGSAEAILRLVDRWLAEDKGYDAEAWPIIEQDIEEHRLSERSRFNG